MVATILRCLRVLLALLTLSACAQASPTPIPIQVTLRAPETATPAQVVAQVPTAQAPTPQPTPSLVKTVVVLVPAPAETSVTPVSSVTATAQPTGTAAPAATASPPPTLASSTTPSSVASTATVPATPITATPQITATTAVTATAKVTVTVPANWKEYVDITDAFSFRYPPDWKVFSQRPGVVAFELPGATNVQIGLTDESLTGKIGNTDAVNDLVRKVTNQAEGKAVRLVAKGPWYILIPANYVELEVVDAQKATEEYTFAVPVDNSHSLLGRIVRINQPVSEETLQNFSKAVATFKLK